MFLSDFLRESSWTSIVLFQAFKKRDRKYREEVVLSVAHVRGMVMMTEGPRQISLRRDGLNFSIPMVTMDTAGSWWVQSVCLSLTTRKSRQA